MSIRVLHIVSIMNRGGIETFLMNIYRKLDKKKVQFDFLCNKEEEGIFEEEIKNLGGRIYKIPSLSKVGYLKHKRSFKQFLIQHPEYQIIHCHMNTWAGLYLPMARKLGVKVRIAHSHTSKFDEGKGMKEKVKILIKRYHKLFISYGATKYCACSSLSGKYLFGEKNMNQRGKVITNGIDVQTFTFDENIRLKKRKELKLEPDTVVLGHVGRFNRVKNHEELIDVFVKCLEKLSNMKLCLVGDGELKEEIEEKVKKLGVQDEVIFLGARGDVNEWMMAFDMLVFPSFYEGLPVTLIEAQVSGLPMVISEGITREVDLGLELVEFLPLNNITMWKDYILNKMSNQIQSRKTDSVSIQNKGYDIQHTVEYLEKFYMEAYKGGEETM